jgi:hypothetical protein
MCNGGGMGHTRAIRLCYPKRLRKAERNIMADHDPQDLVKARKVLVEMRHKRIKEIASRDTEEAISGLIEVQQAIDVIDHAIDELEETEEEDGDEDD